MRLGRRKSKEVEQPKKEYDSVARFRFQAAFASQLRKILNEKTDESKNSDDTPE